MKFVRGDGSVHIPGQEELLARRVRKTSVLHIIVRFEGADEFWAWVNPGVVHHPASSRFYKILVTVRREQFQILISNLWTKINIELTALWLTIVASICTIKGFGQRASWFLRYPVTMLSSEITASVVSDSIVEPWKQLWYAKLVVFGMLSNDVMVL